MSNNKYKSKLNKDKLTDRFSIYNKTFLEFCLECELCGKKFTSKRSLSRHKDTNHFGKNVFLFLIVFRRVLS